MHLLLLLIPCTLAQIVNRRQLSKAPNPIKGQSMTTSQADSILLKLAEEQKQVSKGNTSWWTLGPVYSEDDIGVEADYFTAYTLNEPPPVRGFSWSWPDTVYPGPSSLPRPPYAANRPSNNFVWNIGGINTIKRPWPGSYWWHVVPDAHIPTLRTSDGNNWMIIWSEATNFRSVINSTLPWWDQPFPTHKMNPSFVGGWNIIYPTPIFGGDTAGNKGKWLMAVHRHPFRGGKNLVGFYHFQDHQWANGQVTSPADQCWKSIGVAYSNNDGVSWVDGGVIITSQRAKPSSPAWGGVGDFGAIWDWKANHWKLYYSEDKLGVAISEDPDGRPGTWIKWRGTFTPEANAVFRDPWNPTGVPIQAYWNDGGRARAGTGDNYIKGFRSPGLGGGYQYLPGLDAAPGANPSVCYSTYLQKYIMAWSAWNRKIYFSHSVDGLNWAKALLLVESDYLTRGCRGCRAWHPTLVGATGGSTLCDGQTIRLYYSDNWRADWPSYRGPDTLDTRDVVWREIRFTRRD